jgi:uncharacterized membrane protein
MTDVPMAADQVTQLTVPERHARLRFSAILVYLLMCGLVTAIPAVTLAYMRRGEAVETAYESHFANAIELFWVAVVVGVAAAPLIYLFGLGLAIDAALLAWLGQRIVKGLACALHSRPCPPKRDVVGNRRAS